VAVILFQHSPLFENSIPLTVFGVDRRGHGLPYYRLLACMGEAGPLPTTGGILLATPYGLAAAEAAGTVIVPAWRSPTDRPPEPALATLRRAAKEGARILGLDSGVFVLAAAGLLDGRPCTTHWLYAPTLARRYPRAQVLPRELCVDDGEIVTGAGAAAGIDACCTWCAATTAPKPPPAWPEGWSSRPAGAAARRRISTTTSPTSCAETPWPTR
jgi:transcriptional regulator GlxA family with amidase domain